LAAKLCKKRIQKVALSDLYVLDGIDTEIFQQENA
jgi:hypothetical protein